MVSKASDDLPEPESPVKTTSRSRGISTSMFLRLCSRAPRIAITRVSRIPTSLTFASRRRARDLSNRSFIDSFFGLAIAGAGGPELRDIGRTAGFRQPKARYRSKPGDNGVIGKIRWGFQETGEEEV